LLKAKLEDAISTEKTQQDLEAAKRAAEKARLAAEAEQREIQAKEKAEAEANRMRLEAEAKAAAEAEAQRKMEVEQEPIPVAEEDSKTQEPEELQVERIGEAEHEAIMRTIEEMSRSIGLPKGDSPESRFHAKPTLGDKASRQKLNDIKRGIGINERFLYANELFNGDMSAFSRAVEELNHVESETDANRLLNQDLATKYRWDEESETVVAFKSLVSRRFA